jgi:YHS domain-containing protein
MVDQYQGRNIDPVCGMKTDTARGDLKSELRGRTYSFCSEQCKQAFDKKPDYYLKPKGFFGRFLQRLAKSNEKAFGPGGPSCCH